MSTQKEFVSLSRQKFRRFFQPSRIVLAIVPAPNESGVNVITVCFEMYCSYKPPMMALAIHNINESYELIRSAKEFVLAVPGEDMAAETMFCGVNSIREVPDKIKALSLELTAGVHVATPGLAKAIANIELVKEHALTTGDHVLVIGRVLDFRVRVNCNLAPLLSIGPETTGFKVLAQRGIHRIATINK